MEFTVKSNDVSNTLLISADGSQTFRIKTPHKVLSSNVTYIKSVHPLVTGEEAERAIGDITWSPSKELDQIHPVGGLVMKRSQFLRGPQKSTIQRWTASDGKEYMWKFEKPLQLFKIGADNKPSDICLAYYETGSFFRRKRAKLVVLPEAEAILESIIVAFAYMQIFMQREPSEVRWVKDAEFTWYREQGEQGN